jgi:Caspase domain/TIR domain
VEADVTLQNAHALTIGISQYRHVTALPATQDAEDVANVLRDASLGGYPEQNVRSLLDGAATKAAIVTELEQLASCTDDRSTVFIYFSGHGGRAIGASGETCYLMPVDGRDGSPEALSDTAISGPELSAHLNKISAAKLTVVLDCCRAAGVAAPKDIELGVLAPELSGIALAPLSQGRGRAVLAASRSDGYAYVVPGARNGVFTGHLLDGLRGAAGGTGGVIRVCDLFHYVQQRIVAEQGRQRPVFKAELEENYPVALYQGGVAAPPVVPPPADGYAYDVFLSYRHSDRADRQFVVNVVAPMLERLGLRVCLEHRDFRLGTPRIAEMERAVVTSRYTVGVFTPSYLEGAFEELQADLARFQATETRAPRFIPLIRRPCSLALGVRMTALLDVTDDADVDAALQRLAVQLREVPRPRLGL